MTKPIVLTEQYTPEQGRKLMKKKNSPSTEERDIFFRDIDFIAWEFKLIFLREHQFHETRKWQFDRCLDHLKIAVEWEGIFSKKSGHLTVKGYSDNCEKYNAAQLDGWIVLRYTAITKSRARIEIVDAIHRRIVRKE